VPRFRPTDSRDALRSLGITAVFVLFILLIDLWVKPKHGLLYSILLGVLMLYTVVAFNSRAYGFRCSKCKHQYQVNGFSNFFSPTSVGKNDNGTYYAYKWLVCPKCGRRAKAIVLRKADLVGAKLLKTRR
jgi:hypothetical protein